MHSELHRYCFGIFGGLFSSIYFVLINRGSDDERVRARLQLKARQGLDCANSKKRVVNFVIFVVDAISVLKSMQGEDHGQYTKLIEEAFRLPCLSFKGMILLLCSSIAYHNDRF